MSASRPCVIISAFIASGKTWLTAHSKSLSISGYKVLDLDSTMFPKVDGQRTSGFKEAYIAKVKQSIAPNTIILLSTHEEIRSALVEEGLNFALVYPPEDLKEEWMGRLHARSSPQSLVDIVHRNWSSMLGECADQGGCTQFVLQRGQYLSDIMDDVIKNMGSQR
jgi:hypothetical protein